MAPCPICHRVVCLEPHDPETRRTWLALQKKLLGIGGLRVIWIGNDQKQLPDLLECGQVFLDRVQMQAGELHACHENSAMLWEKDANQTRICTGYGRLNGLWQQHSWARNSNGIQETTFKHECYFGMVLSDFDALKFWHANLAMHRADADEACQKLVKRFPHLLSVMRQMASFRGPKPPVNENLGK